MFWWAFLQPQNTCLQYLYKHYFFPPIQTIVMIHTLHGITWHTMIQHLNKGLIIVMVTTQMALSKTHSSAKAWQFSLIKPNQYWYLSEFPWSQMHWLVVVRGFSPYLLVYSGWKKPTHYGNLFRSLRICTKVLVRSMHCTLTKCWKCRP